jgi:hypothetical protein
MGNYKKLYNIGLSLIVTVVGMSVLLLFFLCSRSPRMTETNNVKTINRSKSQTEKTNPIDTIYREKIVERVIRDTVFKTVIPSKPTVTDTVTKIPQRSSTQPQI